MKRRSRVRDVILGKQCLRLYKLEGGFPSPEISLLLVGETLPNPPIERTVPVRLRPAK